VKRTLVTTRAAFAAAMVALTACQSPQPPATPLPPAPTATGYGALPPQTASAPVPGGDAQRFVTGLDVPGQWWTLFHSEKLNALVARAIAANPDVAAAQAALRQARETYYAQKSSAYPTAQGSGSVSRQQLPTYYAPPLNANNSEYIYGVHTLSLDVAYTPDVFGNLRYQSASAGAALTAQRFMTEATYLTLTSNVVITVLQAAELRSQIATAKRAIAIDQDLLDLTRTQRTYAQAAGLDVLTQVSALRAAQAVIPPLEKQLAQTRDALARLVGASPDAAPDADFYLDALHLPDTLPLSLPSSLVAHRPDIAAAEANLTQESAEVGVAYTNRLPNFAITAQTATQALSLGALFGAGTFLSNLTAQVTQTFYDHGTLKHREAAAIAAYDQAAATYVGTTLSGLQNVADALAALKTDADALRAAYDEQLAAQRALEIVRSQQALGAVSALVTLNAEQADVQAELSVVQARANRYMDTAALFEALGGGWWNRTETAPQH
jgi:NodT family efflux transporter outer membrane factor (OMF) lipoprotein